MFSTTRFVPATTLVVAFSLAFCHLHPAVGSAGRGPAARGASAGLSRAIRGIASRGGRPETAVEVMALWDHLDEVDPVWLKAALGRLVRRPLHPLVSFWVDRLLGRLALDQGRRAQARRLWQRQGMPASGLMMGPFGDEYGQGLSTRFGPDEDGGVRLDRHPAGRHAGLSWRLVSADPDGCFRPEKFVRPVGHGVVYMAFGLRVSRATNLVVRMGSASAYRVSVDGRACGEHKGTRSVRPDQEVWPLHVGRGDHLLMVKMAAADSGWGLCLRVTDRLGRPMPRVKWLGRPAELERATALAATAQVQMLSQDKALCLSRVLEGAWEKSRAWAQGRRLVRYLLFMGEEGKPSDRARAVARKLASMRPGAEAWLLVAEASLASERLDALLKALASAPSDGAVLGRLAGWYLDRGRLGEAMRLVVRAQGFAGRRVGAGRRRRQSVGRRLTLLLAKIDQAAGLWAESEKLARRILAQAPWHLGAIRLLVGILLDSDRAAEAVRLVEKIRSTRPGDISLARLAFQAASAALDSSRALAALESILHNHPFDTETAVRLVDLLVAQRRYRRAEALVRKMVALVPRDASLHRALGRVLLAQGRPGAARRAWHRSLALEPQQEDLRSKLAVMRAVRPDPTVERYRLDRGSVARRAGPPKGDAEVLADRMVYVMRSNGAIHRFCHRIVRVNTERGARLAATWSISVHPEAERFTLLSARVVHPDGSMQDAQVRFQKEISNWQIRIYYDWKSYEIQFPKLHKGDLVEVSYTLSDVAQYNPFRGYLGMVVPFEEEMPRRSFEIVVEAPAGRKLYYNKPSVSTQFTRKVVSGTQILHWSAKDLPGVSAEPRAPGWSELVPYLHVSTFRSWSDVSHWYWGLVRDQYGSSPEVEALARRLGRGAKSVEDKVRAVYAFVTRKIRYVGLEFGIHTHKPYSASQVLERRFGDCKDKAMLMVVLLGRLGVEARPVLVRTRQNGALGAFPASLAVFDHAIVYVPALRRFLDGTAEFTGPDDLPFQDQGVMGLVVGPDAGKLTTIPVLPAGHNQSRRHIKISVSRSGRAMVDDRMEMTGQFAAQWRAWYRDEAKRKRLMELNLGRFFPGASIRSLSVTGDRNPERPVVVTMRYEVPALVHRSGDAYVVNLGGRGRLVEIFAPLTKRRQPLILDFPLVLHSKFQLVLPKGVVVTSVPRSLARRVGKGRLDLVFRQKVTQSGRVLSMSRLLKLGRERVSVADYPAFRAFCSAVDAAMADQVLAKGFALSGRAGQ